jgi:hypothetical protein
MLAMASMLVLPIQIVISEDHLSGQQKNPVIAFAAELSQDTNVFENTQIVFDRVLANIGGRYAPLVGSFLCPDANLYVFMWTLHAPDDRRARAMLMVGNDEAKYGPYTPQTNEEDGIGSGTSQMASVIRCANNTIVRVMAMEWPENTTFSRYAGVYSSFVGFRLSSEEEVGFTAEMSNAISCCHFQ